MISDGCHRGWGRGWTQACSLSRGMVAAADLIFLAPQAPLIPNQTPLMKRRTTMTLEQPSLGPRGLGVAPPSTLLLYHPSTSKRLRPRAEVEGHSPSSSSSAHPSACRNLEPKAWPPV